jgi:aspartyl protease family protein
VLRTYIIILVLVGLAAVMFGRLPSTSSAGRDSVIMVKHRNDVLPANGDSVPGAAQTVNSLEGSIELDRAPNGYFYADVEINGAPVHMVVDTGATVIALSRDDARAAGIATSIGMNEVVAQGADGEVKGEHVTLDRVALGSKTVEGVPAIVLGSGEQSLLGESFLSRFASVKIEGDKMVLR